MVIVCYSESVLVISHGNFSVHYIIMKIKTTYLTY